jgi:hypothetical protein
VNQSGLPQYIILTCLIAAFDGDVNFGRPHDNYKGYLINGIRVSGILGLSPKPARIGSLQPLWYDLIPGDVKEFGVFLGKKRGRLTLG